MKNVIKNVINREEFELSDILKKIDTCWVKGNLNDEEKAELSALAQTKAKSENSIDVMKKLEEIEQRLKLLEEKADSEPTEEYPEFVINKWYYGNDKITFEGKKYKCIAPEGVTCVWSPKDYPAYWETVTE